MSGIGETIGHILHDAVAPVVEAIVPGARGHALGEAVAELGTALEGEHDAPAAGATAEGATDGAPVEGAVIDSAELSAAEFAEEVRAAASGVPESGAAPDGAPATAEGAPSPAAAVEASEGTPAGDRPADGQETAGAAAGPVIGDVEAQHAPGALMVANCATCNRSAVVHAGPDGFAPTCPTCGGLQTDVTPAPASPLALAPAAVEG